MGRNGWGDGSRRRWNETGPRPSSSPSPSPLSKWRQCCCRYGWYPLLVAPFVTAGCVTSLYSAAGCDFLRLDVGFVPSNGAWNENTIDLGLFLYRGGDEEPQQHQQQQVGGTNLFQETFVEGCRGYSDEFVDSFIDGDRTWRVSRIMAYIAGGASILATVTAWLFVVSPLPASFFWPWVMLPALMASLIAEASAFLFFDTAICRNSVWLPPGDGASPRPAQACSLGATGKVTIASGAIFFVSFLMVCLKAPERRGNYGPDRETGDMDSSRARDKDSNHDATSEDYMDTSSEPEHYAITRHRGGSDDAESGLSNSIRDDDDDDELLSYRLNSLDFGEDKYTNRPIDGEPGDVVDGDKYNLQKPSSIVISHHDWPIVSESRLSTKEKMQMNSAAEAETEMMIDQLVSELNESFRVSVGHENEIQPDQQASSGCLRTERTIQTNFFHTLVCGNDETESVSSKQDQPLQLQHAS